MQKKIITSNNDMPKNIWHCWRHRYFTTFRKRAWWKTCSVSSPTFVIYLWDLTETAQKTVHTGNGQPSATREAARPVRQSLERQSQVQSSPSCGSTQPCLTRHSWLPQQLTPDEVTDKAEWRSWHKCVTQYFW